MFKKLKNYKISQHDLLLILTVLSSGTLIISNLAAVKLWDFCGIAVDGGIIVFPLSYIISDLLVEFFGRKSAMKVIVLSTMTNLLAVFIFVLAGKLPAFNGWDGQAAYETIFYFAPRVVFGSMTAFLVSQLLDHYLFIRIRRKFGRSRFWFNSVLSTAFALIFDSFIFETIAFYGVLPFRDFLAQAAFAWAAGVVLEIILAPVTNLIVRFLRKNLP